ncbi:hypothetical protein JVX93_15835 [Mycolicibacterium boenickei]|nr:hypothetical protein JVX93_15835 [Mycolicibacterium boenickei]
MPRPINHDDARCELCDCLGIQHEDPERGGPCTTPDGRGGHCDCPGFEMPPDDDEEGDRYA